jgi:uncharacterized protein (DUF488 family)
LAVRCRRSFQTSDLLPVYTVGHSTRSIPQFAEILRAAGVQLVVDVRTVPRSRTNPQFNAEVLGTKLQPWQIAYDRLAELGGLRGRSRDIDPKVNGFWQNQSFHNYADYALSDDFDRGFTQLLSFAAERSTAIMCSEAVWWRCHRRIIADYLLLRGRTVVHLMGLGRSEPARMTSAAKERDGRLVYPALPDNPGTDG